MFAWCLPRRLQHGHDDNGAGYSRRSDCRKDISDAILVPRADASRGRRFNGRIFEPGMLRINDFKMLVKVASRARARGLPAKELH